MYANVLLVLLYVLKNCRDGLNWDLLIPLFILLSQTCGLLDFRTLMSISSHACDAVSFFCDAEFNVLAGNPRGQVNSAVSEWRSHNLKYGMMWCASFFAFIDCHAMLASNLFICSGVNSYPTRLDIEISDWGACDSNYAFVQDLVAEAQALGVHLGIYTNAHNWVNIMCGKTGFESIPLWYACFLIFLFYLLQCSVSSPAHACVCFVRR